MYATGMRVSEVARLRFRDLDFDRSLINIWQGKGRTDRQAMLPRTFEELLKSQAKLHSGDDYLFQLKYQVVARETYSRNFNRKAIFHRERSLE